MPKAEWSGALGPFRVKEEPSDRPVPYMSGEAAIYSIEYLVKREGNARGARAYLTPYQREWYG